MTEADVQPVAETAPKTYRCGTLTYTKGGLVALFSWLLWGDFCFTLMEAVVPSILPLKLKDLGVSNLTMGLILTTLPSVLNMTVCPYVSFKSDRCRSRWGRRIPFILVTMPFLCLCLLGLAYGDQLGVLLRAHCASFREAAPATATVLVIGVFYIAFQFFNMFVGSVYWYLFSDVVPTPFLGRFFGAFRIVGGTAGALYSYFLFKYAESNMKEIFIGATLLYAVGMGMMCFLTKEGEYPPLNNESGKGSRGLEGVKSFLKESFSCKFYLTIFVFTSLSAVIAVVSKFNVFFYKDMGLSLDEMGKAAAIMGLAMLGAMYFTAIFVDRWHPLRVGVYWGVFTVIASLGNWVWVFVTLPVKYFFWLNVMGVGLIGSFLGALGTVCFFPMCMRTFPKSRFGQFCSAQALLRSVLELVAGLASGLFFDVIKGWSGGGDFAYRYIFAWNTAFALALAAVGISVYAQWHRLGADEHYRSPAPWSPEGSEAADVMPFAGPHYKWLNLALTLLRLTMLLSVLFLPFLMWWMHGKGAALAFRWHLAALLPASVVIWGIWVWLERSLRADIGRCAAGEKPRQGIVHHGVLMVVGINYLMALSIWIVEVVIAVNLKLEVGAIVFTAANVLTNILLIAGVALLRRVEKGRSERIDGGGTLPVPLEP